MNSIKPIELNWLDIQCGDIIAVHSGKSLVAKGIVTHMKLWLKANGYDLDQFPHIIHHIGRVVDVWGYMNVAEAIEKGVVVHPMLTAYTVKEWKERIIVLRRKSGYGEEQLKSLSKEMQRLAMIGSPYEFGNFWRHIVYFLNAKRKWYGGGKSDEAYYCSELGAYGENFVYSGSFAHPERTNPMEVFLFEGYDIVYQCFDDSD